MPETKAITRPKSPHLIPRPPPQKSSSISQSITVRSISPPRGKAKSPVPTKGGEKQLLPDVVGLTSSASSGQRSSVYLRADKELNKRQKTVSDGKFVIPKILTESVTVRRDNDSAKVRDTGVYEEIAPAPVSVKPSADVDSQKSRRSEDLSINRSRSKSCKLTTGRRSVVEKPAKKPAVPVPSSQRSDISLKSGRSFTDRSEKRRRARFIRATMQDTAYNESPLCPRIGFLVAIWTTCLVITVLMVNFVARIDIIAMKIAKPDDTSCFMAVFLKEDSEAP